MDVPFAEKPHLLVRIAPVVPLCGLTFAITGGQKHSEAALLPVRVDGVVRGLDHLESSDIWAQ